MNPFGFLKDKATNLAAAGFNAIPDDRANMFLRYYTGFGNKGLDLEDSTLHTAREHTVGLPTEAFKEIDNQLLEDPSGVRKSWPVPFKVGPQSGSINPYSSPAPGAQTLKQTLGRYTSEVSPDQSTVRFIDQYDMSNEFEDPDLISGKFQPRKAWNELSTIWDPRANWERRVERNIAGGASFGEATGLKRIPEAKGFSIPNIMAGVKNSAQSGTSSPLPTMARALMYLTPKKFTPYDVDVTVPYSGPINNQETYQ